LAGRPLPANPHERYPLVYAKVALLRRAERTPSAAAAAAQGWPEQVVDAARRQLQSNAEMQIKIMDQLMDAWEEQIKLPNPMTASPSAMLSKLQSLPGFASTGSAATNPLELWMQLAQQWQRTWADRWALANAIDPGKAPSNARPTWQLAQVRSRYACSHPFYGRNRTVEPEIDAVGTGSIATGLSQRQVRAWRSVALAGAQLAGGSGLVLFTSAGAELFARRWTGCPRRPSNVLLRLTF
jgi:hypothetical protein